MLTSNLRVTMAPDGFYPRSWRWQGRGVRVLTVEEVYTSGLERRYRVRTPEGRYELGYHTGTGEWQMRRAPMWFQRLWAHMQDVPRYPLPARRRRGQRQAATPAASARPVKMSLRAARAPVAG